jgi:hypothetical protein
MNSWDTLFLRNNVILQNASEAEDRAEDQGFLIADNTIMEEPEILSFASIHQIAKMTFIVPTAAFRHLTKSLRFVLKRLRWVPRDCWVFQTGSDRHAK